MSDNFYQFIQNKANLQRAQMSTSLYEQKDYEKRTCGVFRKNKPKQSQFVKAELKGVRL